MHTPNLKEVKQASAHIAVEILERMEGMFMGHEESKDYPTGRDIESSRGN